MQNYNIVVGRGSTRGMRRGPTAHQDVERRLAVTWENDRGASHLATVHWMAIEMTPRRAITWEGPTPTLMAADEPAETTESQVIMNFNGCRTLPKKKKTY